MKFIYKITCIPTGKVYIGKTEIGIQNRWDDHVRTAQLPSHRDYDFPFHRAIRKYGANAFTIEEIDKTEDSEELKEKEKYWIKFYDSYNNGYNATIGGDGQCKYDYDAIVNYYLANGNSLALTCQHFGIYDQVVYSALKSKDIDYKNLKSTAKRQKYGKKIYCVELDKTFNNMAEIDSFFRKSVHGNIRRALNGITKKAYGYTWKEVD